MWENIIWTVFFSLPLGVGWVAMSLTPPEFTVARVGFIIAALVLLGRVCWWIAIENHFTHKSLIIISISAAFLFIGLCLSCGLYWMDNRELIAKQNEVANNKKNSPTVKEIADEVVKRLPDFRELIAGVAKDRQKELRSQFPEGFAVFGIIKPGEKLVPGFVPDGIDINWDTGKVMELNSQFVSFVMPDMIITRGGISGATFTKQLVTIPRRVGFVGSYAEINDLSLQVKVLTDIDPVIIALGFVIMKGKQ